MAAASVPLSAVPAQASKGPALTVYVAPDGKDTGKGTADHPFKTLEHARDYVRDAKSKVRGDIHVRLKSGTYQLSRTFALTAKDSGTGGQRIVYEAAPGAHPVVSGGKQVTGWTKADAEGKVYKAKLTGLDTRQLYV
ncbi:discoidin domain-containing protein, partial [Streptomyces sp. NPDC002499]